MLLISIAFFCFYTMREKRKYIEILSKLQRYCKYQERCEYDLEKKLNSLKVIGKMKESIIHELYENKYFDNKRFADEYVIGKFRNNKWGKIKIRYNLKSKSIDKKIVDESLNKISQEEYISVFCKIAKREWIKRLKLDSKSRTRRFYNTLQSKGWEYDLIKDFLSGMKKNKI